MPEGGNPALAIEGNVIAVSGVSTYYYQNQQELILILSLRLIVMKLSVPMALLQDI